MRLETVLVIIFLTPIVLGFISAFFNGSSATPIIIDYRTSLPATAISDSNSEEEFLVKVSKEPLEPKLVQKLEDSPEALEWLENIEYKEELNVSKPIQYKSTEIPIALDKSLEELFMAIDGKDETDRSVSCDNQNQTFHDDSPLISDGDPKVRADFPMKTASYIPSAEEFEAAVPSIDEMIDQMSSYSEDSGGKVINFPCGENLPLPPREYWALQQKYGPEVISKVTTTPGVGGTGEYDCMIGRVIQRDRMALLQYGDHHIPLKGMDNIKGVCLVEGMFIKPGAHCSHSKLAEM